MMFKKETALYGYEVIREAGQEAIYLNYLGASYVPNLAESSEVMSRVIDALIESPNVSRVVFVQQRNYSYDFSQVALLMEIAQLYNYLMKQERILSPEKLVLNLPQFLGKRHDNMTYFLTILKQDPIRACHEVKRFLREARVTLEQLPAHFKVDQMNYIRLLEKISILMENTRLIKESSPYFDNYKPGARDIYNQFFRADIIPNFTFTRLVAQFPADAELVDQYMLKEENEEITVTILKRKNEAKYFYHILPPEYTLSEEHHMLLHLSRNVLIEHRPKSEEFTDPEKTRQVFFNVAKDLLSELAQSKKVALSHRELMKLSNILVRYTIGFGLIEILLLDDKLQDIVLNAPIAQNPIFIRHESYDECITNILPSYEDAESWAAKLRLQSGRPLDEAHPILDSDLVFGNLRARIAAIKEPLSPSGLAYAIRRHRDKPWTLPLFIKRKMINSFAAGLLSFIIDGSRTLLVAGTRSSGKTSLLGSLMLEISPKIRNIIVEDTLELPADAMRKLGYDILRMKVRSALVSGTTEIEASEGIRASLRMGDSALIVGEVRSSEAKALYEAMRIGALANVVAGTIHGDSPYGVFDRVVHDLGVPATSFKATDIIVITNPVKTPDGMKSVRRVLSITEVRKHWINDPVQEGGFVDLMRYNVEKDELEPTPELINGESEVLKSIASQVKGWAGNWDAIYDNIILRGKIKQEMVELSEKLGKPEILEAEFNVLAQTAFHKISEKTTEEKGLPLGESVFPEWKKWLMNEIKRIA